MARANSAIWVCLCAAGVGGGCSAEPGAGPTQPPSVSPDAAAISDAGEDRWETVDAATGAEAGADASARKDVLVPVGLVPTPRTSLEDRDDWAARVEAILAALSAGADSVVLNVRWSEMMAFGSAPDEAAWHRLGQLAELVRERNHGLLLSVRTVDGVADRRPEHLRYLSWDDSSTSAAMRSIVDEVYKACGPELRFLSLGMELDRYGAAHVSEQPALEQFAISAVTYAREHASRPEATHVGMTWSADRWLRADVGAPGGWEPVDAASDVLFVSYDGWTPGEGIRSPAVAVTELATLLGENPGRLVVLQQVATTSSALLGSSEASQAELLRALFGTVDSMRDRCSFVGVANLHDPSMAECLAYAESRGCPESAECYAYWCSTGLRTRSGVAKLAFDEFLHGLSKVSSP